MAINIGEHIEVLELVAELDQTGESAQRLEDWTQLGAKALLLEAPDLRYLVEPQPGRPPLITHLWETLVLVRFDHLHKPEVRFRSEGKIDTSLSVGQRVTIHRQTGGLLNPGVSWCHTKPLSDIKYL